MPHSRNAILARLDPTDLAHLEPHLRVVELVQGQVLAHSMRKVDKVYFPHGGILSSFVELKSGDAIETGLIGHDGVFGATLALDHRVSLNQVVVQVPGLATVVNANVIQEVAQSSMHFRELLVDYEQFFLAQVQQTCACNARHSVEQRICKWLLRMYHLAGANLFLTQEYLAQMIGVRRTSVTIAASELQKLGLITYTRGRLQIIDLQRVHQRACECHDTMRDRYDEMFGRICDSVA